MDSTPAGQDAYSSGVAHLHQGDLDQALQAFDKAFEIGASDPRPTYTRLEVLRSVQELDSVPDPEPMSSDELEQHAPRLFARLAQLPARVRDVLLRPPSFNPTPCTSDAAGPLENHIDRLPAELITLIGHHALDDYPPLGFGSIVEPMRLLAVSRRWRSVFSGDLAFWDGIERGIRGARDDVRLLVRMERVGDCLGEGHDIHEKKMQEALLEVLSASRREKVLDAVWSLKDPAIGQSCRSLADRWIALSAWDVITQLRCTRSPRRLDRLGRIRYLDIGVFDPRQPISPNEMSLAPLLQHNWLPNLDNLTVNHPSITFAQADATPAHPSVIVLPRLQTLDPFNRERNRELDSVLVHLPTLETVFWENSDADTIFSWLKPPSPYPTDLRCLRTLCLYGCLDLDETRLIKLIPEMPALCTLNVDGGDCSDTLLDTLCWPTSPDDGQGLCPKLSRLGIGANPRLTNEAIMRMVSSRYDAFGREECVQLRDLEMDEIQGKEAEEIETFLAERVIELTWH